MKTTEIKCKYCGKKVMKKKSFAKFCNDNCRKKYWAKFVEPRGVCEDCGTLLGIHSLKNIRAGLHKPFCASCAGFRRHGVGRDI